MRMTRKAAYWRKRNEADHFMEKYGERAWWEAHIEARRHMQASRKEFDFYQSVAREIARRTDQEIE